MAGNNGGPWGGGGGSDGDDRNRGGDRGNDNRRPGPEGGRSEIDDLMKKGQEQLRVLMGGRGGNGSGPGGPTGGEPFPTRTVVGIGFVVAFIAWIAASFYTVRPEEQSVELFLGEFSSTGGPGLNFAPWPLVTYEVEAVTRENTEDIGVGRGGQRGDAGLMLTTDENIVDIDFQVVWNISNLEHFKFNLADGQQTVRAVSEAAMREIIAQSELSPILNRDRELIADTVTILIQSTLDSYESGINIVRVNLDRADPPSEVIDAFRDVQAAEQERDRLERQADAYANRVLAGARGEAAQVLEEAEGYRARVVNEAQGEASRFLAVLTEYRLAPEVTRKRLYLETMERVLGDVNKVILDDNGSGNGQGVVPYLPLNELRRNTTTAEN
ncbi:FtsH protease activity modulator HflK [Pseudaestuariivita rosea]|uniref:FtsH protease activity modulator HflK n=1 Tax=Pseudaestuariivita rosea TaxID=2763263 RepID=UPI001ABA212C|nr:FtsH protease activity modulator HflK [Pseudaestuariivita rosea]